jgi:von Willebrand factor type A domain/Bacterial TSP3 repeat
MRYALILCALASQVACRSPGLEAVRPQQVTLDDLMQVNIDVCTQPASDALFPVKILFILDMSDSMSVVDRDGFRGQATLNAIQRFSGNPAIQFGILKFNSQTTILGDGFTNTPMVGAASLDESDALTDYQGALGTAYTLLSQDMQRSSPAERARTKYVLVFLTDGTPDPQCSGTEEDTFIGVCEVPRQDWATRFDPPLDSSLYPALEAGGDYNQPHQIYKAVDDIMALQDAYRVAEIRLHTALLYNEQAVADALASGMAFDIDRPRAEALLRGVAEHGNGTYSEFTEARDVSFLNFNYTSVKEPNAIAELVLSNENAIFASQKLSTDTDGDGLDDAREFALKSCPGLGPNCQNPRDSDGDSYGDFFEETFKESGFDLVDRNKPLQACRARNDSDGDGLRDCEELFLGTDTRLFDSDGDRLTDLQELLAGLDPLNPDDAVGDADNDGLRNIDEIRVHLNPNERNSSSGDADVRYRYLVNKTETRPDGSNCYHGEVQNIRLLTTGTGTDSPRGVSRLMVSFVEAPNDRPLDFGEQRVACAEVRYIAGAVKAPASGIIELKDENFKTPSSFDAARDCVKSSDAP